MTFSLSRLRFGLFTSLLVLAPLSKYPSMSIPLFNFPSFRVGLYQLIVVAFVGLCVVPAWRRRTDFFGGRHGWAGYGLALLAVLGLFSVSWSLYPARSALLAASLILLIALVVAAWWYVRHEFPLPAQDWLLRLMLVAGIGYSLVALAQLVIFSFSDETLGVLCRGCVADVFGFPRVNGFAAEPQFFANALLPFVFAALYALHKKPTRLAWIALVATTGAIGLTFSRGAYLALTVSLVITATMLWRRKIMDGRRILAVSGVIGLSILGSLSLLVASASVRFAHTPHIAYDTVDSIIEHLTLGRIDLPEKLSTPTATQTRDETPFESPGYIEASNEERTSAATLALDAWNSSLTTMLLGVGLGNLGPYVVANVQASAPSNLTVYIYYVLVLAELGIAGLAALLLIFWSGLVALWRSKQPIAVFGLGLLVAFLLQYLFFGTFINSVYIWLWLGVVLGATSTVKQQAKSTPVRRKRV